MMRAEQIEELLREIEGELAGRVFRTDSAIAVSDRPARCAELIDERRRLNLEYEHLPKRAKETPSSVRNGMRDANAGGTSEAI